jgi:hypothetical protein
VHRARFLFAEIFWVLPGSRFSQQCTSPEFMLPARFPFHRPDPVLILPFVATVGMSDGLLLSLSTPALAKCAYTKAWFFSLEFFDFGFDLAAVCRGVSFPIC